MLAHQKDKKGRLHRSFQFAEVGRELIAIRIFRKLSQKELAEKLGVPESEVARNERNEYADYPAERLPQVFSALGASVRLKFGLKKSQA